MPESDTQNSDYEEIQIPFPEMGDQLFVTEQNSHHNAQINYIHSWDTLYRYVLGYKEAADRLAQSLIEDRSMIDLVIFPTVFLYRQYLELRLKQLLIEGNRLLDRQFVLPTHHRIDRLWNDCKCLLKEIQPKMTDQDVAALEGCIIEFSTIDPSSMAFRYHVDTHNNPSLPPDLKYINIHNLAEVMAKIHSFLETWYVMISDFIMREQIDKYSEQQSLLEAELEEEFRSYSEEDWRKYYDILDE